MIINHLIARNHIFNIRKRNLLDDCRVFDKPITKTNNCILSNKKEDSLDDCKLFDRLIIRKLTTTYLI